MLALLAREGLLAEIEAYTHPIRGFPDDVRLRDGVGRTPLHRAVHAGTVDMDAIVMQLASALASPAAGDVADGAGGVSQGGGEGGAADDLPRALDRASAAVVERVRVVELLLQRQAAPDATDACGRTALMEAARSGNVALVRVLLGQTVEQAGVAAASDVHAQLLRNLIETADADGRTALMLAAAECRPEAVAQLVEARADMNAKDTSDWTPLMIAAASDDGSGAAVRQLLACGADVGALTWDGSTALMHAAAAGNLAALQAVIDVGGDVHASDKYGYTALARAIEGGGSAPVVRLLLAAGARCSLPNRAGWTPLILIAMREQPGDEVAHVLLDSLKRHAQPSRGQQQGQQQVLAELDVATASGGTALSYSARNGHSKIVAMLIAEGAGMEIQDHEGWTPLVWAAAHGTYYDTPQYIDMPSLLGILCLNTS
jgi:serine/threonine-protein phosphatase 6 regulatory ankyrin repeat subunit B